MVRQSWNTFTLLLLGVVACASGESTAKRRHFPTGGAEPCTPPQNNLNVIGGTTVDDATYPFSKRLSADGGSCSGTFVSAQVFLTAAHCVADNATPGAYRIEGVSATRVLFNPGYRGGSSLENTDLGVLIFAAREGREHAFLAPQAAKEGDEVTLVGFSANSDNVSRKRSGVNKVSAVLSSGMLEISRRAEEGAISAPGDSGGTVLLGGKLVATMTGGDERSVSNLSHVLTDANLSFLRTVRDQEHVSICGLDGELCAPPTPTPTPESTIPSPTPTPANPCL